ncbi:hypothetical protein B484DRAFT_450060 [Ochromonadaceae sp. CCMP2298]|nr:hypothetical protein B484DRAFT_450060 [Ochromonadaceae sp. CCMP2298]
MSAISKKKVGKFLNEKKMDGELKGEYTLTLRWPLFGLSPGNNFISSPSFAAGGSKWSLLIYPIGIDETSEFLSIRLVNQSQDEVYASYVLSIKSTSAEDYSWKDPEGIVLFSGVQEGDNAWGNDEFIALADLSDSAFIAKKEITFGVEVEVFGRDYLKTETLSKVSVTLITLVTSNPPPYVTTY